MPRYIAIFRKLVVAFGGLSLVMGMVFLLSAPTSLAKKQADLRTAIGSLVVGAILLVPHRKILKSRLGPFWVGLSFLLPAVAVAGFSFSVWVMFRDHFFDAAVFPSVVIVLLLAANAEHARRSYLLESSGLTSGKQQGQSRSA